VVNITNKREKVEKGVAPENTRKDTHTMSTSEDHPLNDCTYTIDRFFYCMSPAGQFTTYYRYGNINECAKEWRDVRYCIRNWTKKGEEKRVRTDHNSKRWEEKD